MPMISQGDRRSRLSMVEPHGEMHETMSDTAPGTGGTG